MPLWNSRGLRGSALEELVNLTNDKYRETGLCLVQKIPTPITPIEFDKEKRHITLAYFDKKSTVDYIGVVQGIPVCFDCKESVTKTFMLQNVHEHQILFMHDFEAQNGVAFILIYFTKLNVYYYLRYSELKLFYERAEKGGRKSIAFEELSEDFFFEGKNNMYVPYLEMIQKDLDTREGS